MDLYLFYNCVNNLTEVLETPEDRLTLRHQIMVNDPLVFSFYLKNLNKKPTSIYSGGGTGPTAAVAPPPPPPPPPPTPPPGAAAAAAKVAPVPGAAAAAKVADKKGDGKGKDGKGKDGKGKGEKKEKMSKTDQLAAKQLKDAKK